MVQNDGPSVAARIYKLASPPGGKRSHKSCATRYVILEGNSLFVLTLIFIHIGFIGACGVIFLYLWLTYYSLNDIQVNFKHILTSMHQMHASDWRRLVAYVTSLAKEFYTIF